MARIPRNLAVSYTSGTLFAIGWWLLIDANVISNYWRFGDGAVSGIHYLPAIGGTISLLLINLISAEALDFNDGNGIFSVEEFFWPRLMLFVGFVMQFASLFGGCYIFINNYIVPTLQPSSELAAGNPDGQNGQLIIKWPGIAVFVQSVLILISCLMMRFARKFE